MILTLDIICLEIFAFLQPTSILVLILDMYKVAANNHYDHHPHRPS